MDVGAGVVAVEVALLFEELRDTGREAATGGNDASTSQLHYSIHPRGLHQPIDSMVLLVLVLGKHTLKNSPSVELYGCLI